MIVFIGFPGVGKSTLGRAYARRANLPFLDSDLLIESLYQKTPKELIKYLGLDAFRTLEERVILNYLNNSNYDNIVFALGGGAIESKKIRKKLQKHLVIYLKLPRFVNIFRLRGDFRGLSLIKLMRLYEYRSNLYKSVASQTLYNYHLKRSLGKLLTTIG
jgi:shikimate kinase